ncbi:MAG: hypothetical protein Q9201_006659 [Fulgogasparrea decipioides]
MSTTTSTTSPPASSSPSGGGGQNSAGPTSSPLLFFVALGFGVVFTNLWIIVGVKYCFRYNQRNRRNHHDENGDPIDMATIPRAHRRRREKKLMTMDEVNDRFPLTKYKTWMATRAEEGLPTAGGVAVPQNPTTSLHHLEGPTSAEIDRPDSRDKEAPTTPTSSAPQEKHEAEKGPVESVNSSKQQPVVLDAADQSTDYQLHQRSDSATSGTARASASNSPTAPTRQEVHNDNDMDDDDQIQIAVPTEMLANPGDSCAICIDTLEDDDDVRGLTHGQRAMQLLRPIATLAAALLA